MKQCKRCGVENQGSEELCPRCLLEVGLAEEPEPRASIGRSHLRPAAPSPRELAPLFPELQIEEMVGQGGMGAVYRATQKALGREVALKVLLGDLGRDPTFAKRFEREARTLAALSHGSCVVIHDFGERQGYFFLLMEFVDGANLRQLLKTRSVAPREALSIVAQICDGLQYAHDQGVVHRDIKPENILVTRDGRVKILDYGLAKLIDPVGEDSHLTGTFQAMGSVHYMAPEQWKHPLEVDHRADIYSLGVVFYELLTGELPVGRFPLPSQKVEIDVRLDEVVLKALEIDPERRWQHASEVKTQMQGLDRTPVRRPLPAKAPRSKKKSGIPVWAIVLIVLVVTLPILFLALLIPVSLLGHRTNDLVGTIEGTLPPSYYEREREIQARLEKPPEELFEPEPGPVPSEELRAARSLDAPIPRDTETVARVPPLLLTRGRLASLGLRVDQAERLEEVLRISLLFQGKYERDAVRSSHRTSPGNVVIEMDAFPEKYDSLHEKVEALLQQRFHGELEVDRLIEVMSPEGLLARGQAPLRIWIQRWGGGFRAREEPIDGASGAVVQYKGEELLPRYQLLWNLAGGESRGLHGQLAVTREFFPRTIDGRTIWVVGELVDLGLPGAEAIAVSDVLETARERYLELEEESSTLAWDAEGHLNVSIGAFLAGEEEAYHEGVWREIRGLVSDRTLLPSLKSYLDLDELFSRGTEPVELDLRIEQGDYYHRCGGMKLGIHLVAGEVPLHAPDRRFWIRGLELARPGK